MPAGDAAAATADDTTTTGDATSARVYFASGSAQLPAETASALQGIVGTMTADPARTAAVSGFNDPSGDAAVNAELSKQRAMNVRDALVAAGIAETRIDLQKPDDTAIAGDAAQARRVEVAVE
ncbi:MAG: OmpA family protein [Thermomonas sp.]